MSPARASDPRDGDLTGGADAMPEGPFVDLAWATEEEDTGGEGGSRILFPLRTGVELFSDPSMPVAAARAKQAAVLYDEVVFETGLYEVSVAAGGSSDSWTPQEWATDERLAGSRRVQTPGTTFSVAIGPEGSEDMNEVISSPLRVAYASEYHTGILDEPILFDQDWVKVLTLGNGPSARTPEGELSRRLAQLDRHDDALMPESRRGDDHFKRRWAIGAFNRDLVVASVIGASFNPTSLFAPLVERRGLAPERSGATALGLVAPNVGILPWEAVLEFRQHAGSVEARAMLREFEQKAAREEPEDANAFLRSIERDVREALFSTVEQLRPRWPKKVAAEALKTAVGMIPTVGQIGGSVLSAAEIGSEWLRYRRSWVAALMVLKRHSS